MDIRPLRTLPAANMTVFLLVCVAFLVHRLGAGLFPDGMGSWFEDNRWVMWAAMVLTGTSALAIPLLSLKTHR
ncbi:hypothetical protein ACFHW2_24585 [Actinomadura sp. LOL_016]|uniref:hypothetical protein n=1 Tax=unclassified Actinomadura TaxID=2626254 RepID=UPI003A802177